MERYQDRYCRLVKFLVPNSLLKSHIKKTTIYNDKFEIKEKHEKYITKYRKLSDGIWLEYKINGIETSYIENSLKRINENFKSKIEKNICILGNSKKQNWNYKRECEYVKDTLKTFIERNPDISLLSTETVFEESYENILSSNYELELRDSSFLLIIFNVKSKSEEKISLTIDRNTIRENIKNEIIQKLEWLVFINSLKPYTVNQLKKDDDKRMICVSKPEFSGRLIHESIGHLSEADVFIQNCKSFDVLGKKLSEKNIHIIDYANGEKIPNQYFIDEEGTNAKNVTIMKNGKIVNLLSDSQNKLTKHHSISGFLRSSQESDYPLIRMRNTAMLSGKEEKTNIIHTVQYGLLLKEYTDGYLNQTNEFTVVAKNAVVIKNGLAVGVIEEIKLESNVFEFLASIDMIANDFKWFSHFNCNKENSVVSISFGSPTIRSKLKLCEVNSI